MKKYKFSLLLIALIVFMIIFTGCGDSVNDNEGKPKVYTSFYPMYDFTSKIAGDKVTINNMVPSGIDVHDWEPAAVDIVSLENADMFVYNGSGMEHWVEGILASIENEKLIVVEASEGVELLDSTDDHHRHDGESDAHVWTNPLNVKILMENIKNALIQLDPANKEYYQENYDFYSNELDKLHQEYVNTLSNLPNKDFVVSHAAFSYMSHEYGLNQMAVEGLFPDSEPNPGRMAKIIDFVRDNNIKVIFFEELASPKIANTIANETGAEVGVLNPLEGLSDEEIENGDDYFSIMRKNLKALSRALE